MSAPDVVVKVARLQKRAAIELDDGRQVLVRKLTYEGFHLRERARTEDTPEAWYALAAWCLPDLAADEVKALLSGDQIAAVVALAAGRVDEVLDALGKAGAGTDPASATPSATSSPA